MTARAAALETATDDELLDELCQRGLLPGVTVRDLVELMMAARDNQQAQLREIVRRLARNHLGKVF